MIRLNEEKTQETFLSEFNKRRDRLGRSEVARCFFFPLRSKKGKKEKKKHTLVTPFCSIDRRFFRSAEKGIFLVADASFFLTKRRQYDSSKFRSLRRYVKIQIFLAFSPTVRN